MPILSSLVFCVRHDEVLLLQRRRFPFVGLWTGPGGKLEPGESPYQCALRELHEETGLIARAPQLRGVVTETSPRDDFQWLLFIYLAERFDGELVASAEGELRWWPLGALPSMPAADNHFLQRVLDVQRPLYQGSFHFDEALQLREIQEFPPLL